MARLSDISAAFYAAVQLNPKGYQCLRTADFVRELEPGTGISACRRQMTG